MAKRGRPKKNEGESFTETIISSPKLRAYLRDLINEEGYGNSRAEVVRTLVWRGIEELINRGVLDRRKGRVDEPAGD